MTADEKTALAYFLNLASDFVKDGHSHSGNSTESCEKSCEENKPALPLAYLVEEEDYADSCESSESLDSHEPNGSLEALAAEVCACQACGLAERRNKPVPGEGARHPLVMVIGEGPGADEDAAGRPFVGRAGQLLDKMLGSIGLFRDRNCYIANMVKCRPPGNRDPAPGEIEACFPFLERQILLLRPQVILCAGRVAAQNLLKTSTGINALRGRFEELPIGDISIPVLATFHPSALLRDESLKRPAWEDLKLLKSHLVFPNEEL